MVFLACILSAFIFDIPPSWQNISLPFTRPFPDPLTTGLKLGDPGEVLPWLQISLSPNIEGRAKHRAQSAVAVPQS